MAPETHKFRNVLDDLLDLGLLIAGLIYFLLGEKMGLVFTDKELAAVASTGATVRILVRKILLRMMGDKLDSLPGETMPPLPAPPKPAAPAEPAAEESEEDAPADETDGALVPPPPTISG